MANQENIKKWIEALRSGKFSQTRERLADTKGFCCLGVACEVAISNGVVIDKCEAGTMDGKKYFEYDGDSGELPGAVADWLGLNGENDYGERYPESNPHLKSANGMKYSASEWNDEMEANFPFIADLIEFTYLTST
jgi:hypothetical protein